jgi:hypothetical protein
MKCGLLSVVIAAALLITVPAVPVVAADAPEIGLAPGLFFRVFHERILIRA